MATKKLADHTLYHLSPKGFWKKFRDAVVVNPEISSGLPIAGVNRYPPPGSRPERYSTPATKASDPAQNPYWKRDVRRAYPRLSVVTQPELASLLLQHPENQALLTGPSPESSSVPALAEKPQGKDLAETITSLASTRKVFSKSNLPPTLPTPFKKWVPQEAENAPHDPHSYFPMILVK
ncbi:NADH dehydrogenase 21 kDa subunit [Punctularia strigosozonata HHB-11173 SS5]|uniref:NADH dehydrogenase 21 kDa subunit n=1 Tax=Punctularia strigosozonata (strain HHB-11173) TaxID=741275 RepID=UPI00044175A5|nr:NADH dehydrogenase 21 kDa subunit [Punctularia strigosozonata HHB-11173 SS5]EIN11982.1 NADH dehydrogenase 21 kDa subunit [Punctularia strigosozonata HHB-11173 SS5]